MLRRPANSRPGTSQSPRLRLFFCLTALLTATLSSSLTQRVWAYGATGHELVSDVAELNMKDSEAGRAALARVHQILTFGESLADASTWADRIKNGAFDDDSTAFLDKVRDTLGQERAHGSWHYVNMPYSAAEYSLQNPGARKDDVVQMARICAQTLRDGKPPVDAPIQFTQREALRLLIHYVGDMQQPLHIGCGYIKTDGETGAFVAPSAGDIGNGVRGDQGGNQLQLPGNGEGRQTNLHSYWDTALVNAAMAERDETTYAQYLHDTLKPEAGWLPTGPLETWPTQWANDSLTKAKIAYTGITLASRADRGWNIKLPENYQQDMAKITEVQLAKGGARLAQILTEVLGKTAPTVP